MIGFNGPLRNFIVVFLVTVCLLQTIAIAHAPVSAVVQLVISPEGEIAISIRHDALAFALGEASADVTDQQIHDLWKETEQSFATLLDSSQQRWSNELQLLADDAIVNWSFYRAPAIQDFRSWKATADGLPHPEAMDVGIRAKLPEGARRIYLRSPEILDQVLLVIERPELERSILPLDPGETSTPIDVSMVRPPVAQSPLLRQQEEVSTSDEESYPKQHWWYTSWRFMRLGFLHIVPYGTDHALFVLGLFLLTPHWKALFWQISAFTVAHTVTLTLGSLECVSISSRIVEPLIALSILSVAIENLCYQGPHQWRVAVAFVFGLIHGLGFASGLQELGLPPSQFIMGMASFSLGVEGGHLAILLLAFLTLGWTSTRKWYRQRISNPLSALIGLLALYWFIDRVLTSI